MYEITQFQVFTTSIFVKYTFTVEGVITIISLSFLFRPCSVDALLFSCLAPLVKIPLGSGLVHNEVRKEQNLCQYVDRILQKYLKEEKKEKIRAPGEGLSLFFQFFPNCFIQNVYNRLLLRKISVSFHQPIRSLSLEMAYQCVMSSQKNCFYKNSLTLRYYFLEKSNTKDSKEEKTNSSSKTTTSSTNENADDDGDYKFDWLLSVSVATVAMLSYAANAGLIQLRRAATN